jgi:hypothetical protein
VRFKYRKGISFLLEDERMRSVREEPGCIATIRFEEGVQVLTPQLLQSLQDRTSGDSHVGATKLPKPEVAT